MDSLIYMNGRFLEGKAATISPLDLSVLRGFGVMDYLRTYRGHPFRMQDHIDRFFRSAREVGLLVPKTPAELEGIIGGLLRRVDYMETSIKLVLTGGLSVDQLTPAGPATFFAVAYPFNPFPKRYFDDGIKVVTEEYRRPFPKAKSTQYLPAIVALRKGAARGAKDVLFYDEKGFLLETGTANFFAVQGGRLLTPKEGVLEGTTREVVLEIASVEQRAIHRSEIESFEGAFLTSSNKEIMPVMQIDDCKVNGAVIPQSIRDLMQAFSEETKRVSAFS